jgi:hypothetical protein
MAKGAAGTRDEHRCTVRPMERALMLIALGLDPRLDYTDPQLQCAWRRRMIEVHPDRGGNGVIAAAVNASYIALASKVEMPQPVDVRL